MNETRLELAIHPDLARLGEVRQAVKEIAEASGLEEDRLFDLQVAVSEACANAIEHGGGREPVQIRVLGAEDRLEVEIYGPAEFAASSVGRAHGNEHRGMGLPLMASLADRFALFAQPGGGTLVSLTFLLGSREDSGVGGDRGWPARTVSSEGSEGAAGSQVGATAGERQLLARVIENSPAGVYVLDTELRYRLTNPAYRAFLDEAFRDRDLTGLHMADAVPQAEELGLVAMLRRVSETGVADSVQEYEYDGFERGTTYWRWTVLPLPAETPPYEILVLIDEITEQVCARQAMERLAEETRQQAAEAERSERRFRSLFEQAAVGIAHVALDGSFLLVNERYAQILGYTVDELRGTTFHEITDPRDLQADLALANELLAGRRATYSMEKRYLRVDGTPVWVRLSGSLVRTPEGEPAYFVAVVEDIEAEKRLEEARAEALAILAESEERFRTLADNIAQLAWMADETGSIFWYNQRWYDYTGTELEQVLGWGWRSVHHPDHVDRVVAKIRRSLESGEGWEDTFPLRAADGSYRWFLSRAVPIRDEDGRVRRWLGTNTDVTEHREASRLDQALNEIGSMLAASLDEDQILDGLVRMVGQAIGADSARIAMRQADGWVIEYADDPAAGRLGRRYEDDELPAALDAFQTGEIVVREDYWDGARHQRVARVGGIASCLNVPLYAGTEFLGVLSLRFESPRAVTAAQAGFARRLATSVSLALQNARLYQTERSMAQNLQEALLTVPGRVDGVRFSHLYRSATREARVGGDFYDVFERGDGLVGILIGDVCGHGVGAATLATLVKETVRAYAYHEPSPDEVLRMTNEVYAHRRDVTGFTTLFFALLDPETGRMTYASAGHPPPLLLAPDGSSAFVEGFSPPLGAFPEAVYRNREAYLRPGDRLVLYTDGVTEARSERSFFGEDRLREELARASDADIESLPRAIFAAVRSHSGGVLNDDVAVLVLQLNAVGSVVEADAAELQLARSGR